MPDDQNTPQSPESTSTPPKISVADAAKGCLTVVVLGFIGLVILAKWATTPDYDAIAKAQAVALSLEVVEESGGKPLLLTDQVRVQPAERREEYVRRLVDLWFTTNSPVRYPTQGVDADWLESDSARRKVKSRMVEQIMEAAMQRHP